jgi:DNA end-binding protein Ku
MSTLFYADEIRDPRVLAYPMPEISPSEIELAEILVDALSMKLELEKYVDRYREALHELIKAKIEGKEIKVAPEVKPTIELMDALKASIEAAKKKAVIHSKNL